MILIYFLSFLLIGMTWLSFRTYVYNSRCINHLKNVIADRDLTYNMIERHLKSYVETLECDIITMNNDQEELKLQFCYDFIRPVKQLQYRIYQSGRDYK